MHSSIERLRAAVRNTRSGQDLPVGKPGIPNWPQDLEPMALAVATAADVIKRYYNAINERRLDDAIALYSEDCTHHNLAFSRPAKGKQICWAGRPKFRVRVLWEHPGDPDDLHFVIDDMSAARSVGVIWHMEIGGVELPNGYGMSFYQVDPAGYITYVRECPEHFAKVASASPALLRLSAPFLRNMSPFPPGITDTLGEELQRIASSLLSSAAATIPDVTGPAAMVEIPQMPPEDEEGGTDVKGMEIKDLQRLQGTWMVAERLSDDESYNKALELMGFSGILKRVAEIIDGRVLIPGDDGSLQLSFVASGVPNFPEMSERYNFGSWTSMPRRDMRPGWQRTRALVSDEGGLHLEVEVGPDGWRVVDTYCLASQDELRVLSAVYCKGETAAVAVAYQRKP